jgi:hypothetical protein
MGEWKRTAWRKAHGEIVTSPSHAGIGPNARALLLTLFPLAWWDEVAPEGRMLESPDPRDGTPAAKLFRMSDLGKTHGERALAVLCRVQTVAVWDGVIVLPKFAKWQRGESTERTRRCKARARGDAFPELFPEREKQTADSRQQTADHLAPLDGARALEAKQVIDRIVAHRARLQLTELTARELDPKHILARLADGVTLDLLLEVVDLRADEATRDPAQAGWLTAVSPFTAPNPNGKPGGWAVSRQRLDTARARGWSSKGTADAAAEYAKLVTLERVKQRQGAQA